MKFTDGYWLLREGVTAAHPAQVHEVAASDGRLDILAPTQPIRRRGDLLKGPVVTISAHAPLPDVIGVTFTHFEGEQPQGRNSRSAQRTSRLTRSTTRSTPRSPPARCRSGWPARAPGRSTSSRAAGC